MRLGRCSGALLENQDAVWKGVEASVACRNGLRKDSLGTVESGQQAACGVLSANLFQNGIADGIDVFLRHSTGDCAIASDFQAPLEK